MSDDGHRAWVSQNRDAYTELLIPRQFLAAHASTTVLDRMPEPLLARLDSVQGSPVPGDSVRACWPVDLLLPLADYADACTRTWTPQLAGHSACAAAEALADHARHLAEQEA
jgi:hypothetical protein